MEPFELIQSQISQGIAFPTELHVCPGMTQISLCILISLFCPLEDTGYLATHRMSWKTVQTEQMQRLLSGCICSLTGNATPWLRCRPDQPSLIQACFIHPYILHLLQIASCRYSFQISRNIRKRTFGHVRPAKIQISLRICASDQNLHWAHFE